MVEVGSITIKGNLDTSEIDRGVLRIHQGFMTVEGQTKSSMVSMQRLGTATQGVVNAFAAIGTTGVAAMAGLASKAPAVAPAIESMKLSLWELTNILGEDLRPAFEKADQMFSSFVNTMQNNPPFKSLIYDVGWLAGATGLGAVLSKLTKIQGLGALALTITLTFKAADIARKVDELVKTALEKYGFGEGISTAGGATAGGVTAGGLGFLGGWGVGRIGGGLLSNAPGMIGRFGGAISKASPYLGLATGMMSINKWQRSYTGIDAIEIAKQMGGMGSVYDMYQPEELRANPNLWTAAMISQNQQEANRKAIIYYTADGAY